MVTHPPEPTSSPLNVHLILFDLSHLNKYSSGPTICFKPRTSVPKSRYSPIGKKKETIKTKTHTHTHTYSNLREKPITVSAAPETLVLNLPCSFWVLGFNTHIIRIWEMETATEAPGALWTAGGAAVPPGDSACRSRYGKPRERWTIDIYIIIYIDIYWKFFKTDHILRYHSRFKNIFNLG